MTDLRQRWADGTAAHGLLSLLPGPVAAEALARTGADYVVVDVQHGAASEADLPGVAARSGRPAPVPLVRTRSPLFPDIGRPLDLGAEGVIVPNVRDAAHARSLPATGPGRAAPRRPAGRARALRRGVRPIGAGPLIEVDTTEPVDVRRFAERIRTALDPSQL